MKYKDFLKNLEIHTTKSRRGKGVRCNLALYVYPDGHGNIYCLTDKGLWIKHKKKNVSTPTNNTLETVDTFIDVVYEMHKRAKGIR